MFINEKSLYFYWDCFFFLYSLECVFPFSSLNKQQHIHIKRLIIFLFASQTKLIKHIHYKTLTIYIILIQCTLTRCDISQQLEVSSGFYFMLNQTFSMSLDQTVSRCYTLVNHCTYILYHLYCVQQKLCLCRAVYLIQTPLNLPNLF